MAAKKATAPKKNAQVAASRQTARQQALAGGATKQAARQAGRQAGQATRASINRPMPQPPAPIDPNMGQGGSYQYSPTQESQYNQPYQDLAAAGATGMLGSTLGRYGQQGQMGDIYGQTAANTLGNYGQLLAPNQNIQGSLANEVQGIQAGNLDVDPAMVQQFGQQEQLLNEQLRRQLGPDYATSSAGVEALGRFQQGKQTALASANFNRLQGLVGMQQGGMQNLANVGQNQGTLYGQNNMDMYNQAMGMRNQQLSGATQMLNQAGQTQQLYANIPQTMGQFGQAMSGQGTATMGALGPYQQDRFGNFQAQQFPTKGEFTGQTLVNQGQLLNQSASAMGGGGGGGGAAPPQASDSAGSGGQMMTPSSGSYAPYGSMGGY